MSFQLMDILQLTVNIIKQKDTNLLQEILQLPAITQLCYHIGCTSMNKTILL